MKIGVIGAAKIAATVSPAIVGSPGLEAWAVASRDLKKAQDFAAKYGFQKAYGSYEELVSDPEVELVYVATPHSHHYEHMMLALTHGKPVLSEKAFTMNADQARKIAAYAREHHLFAAEAIWTRYMPSRPKINELIASGVIGRVNTLTANLSYPIWEVPRLYRPDLCGGALLDIGVYDLNFALMHFGKDIERIETAVEFTDTGVDGMEVNTLFYRDGRMAVLTNSIFARSDRKGIIHGDKGYIVVENFNDPQSVSVFNRKDELVEHYDFPHRINGYEYEFLECARCIREGLTEAPSMPLSDSIEVMELMDYIRSRWGYRFPMEQN